LIAGRKLLLADDSVAIQKVVDLTFTDEGMEVTTVGDGQDALDKLEQFTPDVVLADIYMPGIDGYELCQFIKQSERFRGIPVMLLIGTFEPFDEAEARRVGADDIVTKPFQSIRQLVSRVGSLLSDDAAVKKETAQKYSTLGLTQTEPAEPVVEVQEAGEPANVRVFVEASAMTDSDSESEGHSCPPAIELQTADTMKLEPVEAATEMNPAANDSEDTIEIEAEAIAETDQQSTSEDARSFTDGVLDLGDVDGFVSAPAEDDFVLDLDDEILPPSGERPQVEATPPSTEIESIEITEPVSDVVQQAEQETQPVETQEWTIVSPAAASQPASSVEPDRSPVNSVELSQEAIEAISRRVVEHLSDKVVREIAWEVVPELSELLIKKRLEERE
jgi:CheY-like chemotaxis protein